MATDRKLVYHVHLVDEDGQPHVFGPTDDVPAWARKAITNPSAWGEDNDEVEPLAPVDPAGDDAELDGDDPDEGAPPAYGSMKKAELEAAIAKRNEGREPEDHIEVEAPGNKAELIAALEGDDAELDGDAGDA